jgi:signal transduction histidine kinase
MTQMTPTLSHRTGFRPLAPFARPQTYRALLYFIAALPLGAVGLAAVIAGWSVTLALSFTPLVFPLLFGLRYLVGGLAWTNAALARELLGARVEPRLGTTGQSFWRRALNVLADRAFWKQQLYPLVVWPIALVQVALLANAGQLMALPIYYRWADKEDMYGLFEVDTFAESLSFAAAGVALLVIAVHLTGLFAALTRRLASGLLGRDATAAMRTAAELRRVRLRALKAHAAVSASVVLLLTAIWALTTRAYFWPAWPALGLGLVLALHAWVVLVLERPEVRRRALGSRVLAVTVGFSAALWLFLVGIWALAGAGYFWPAWPLLGLAALLIALAALAATRRGQLEERIEQLEETRAGAVGVHEAELRRIERDLHDGAQASLVALGMNLGMAEQKLRTDPAAARELLAEARRGAGAALDELRDLARGIHPPVLGDRGLEAAVAGLASRSPVHVALSAHLGQRPSAAVETAAYFVVAEALANAGKHAGATRLDIRMWRDGDALVVEVEDDGRGGADPSGHGLTGLRQRVEALDGTLEVTSPPGGPTTVRATLPCAS